MGLYARCDAFRSLTARRSLLDELGGITVLAHERPGFAMSS